jgi:hypothetical protein
MTRERPRASTKATSVAEIFLSTVMSLQGGPARMAAHGRAPPSRARRDSPTTGGPERRAPEAGRPRVGCARDGGKRCGGYRGDVAGVACTGQVGFRGYGPTGARLNLEPPGRGAQAPLRELWTTGVEHPPGRT